jgi:CBS domain-containing protein
MPVVDASGLLVGVVTEADVLRVVTPGDEHRGSTQEALPATVGGLMRPLPITVPPDCDLPTATDLMTCTAIKSLPVVQDGRVVGLVSRSDLIRGLARGHPGPPGH